MGKNENMFVIKYIERLKVQYVQQWTSNCKENNKLTYYTLFKKSYNVDKYISTITITKFRTALAKFRSSAHSLLVERGRHLGIPREHRLCVYCDIYVEDEVHFVMFCPLYENLRHMYFDNIFVLRSSVNNLVLFVFISIDFL